jgi:hypothetical protein
MDTTVNYIPGILIKAGDYYSAFCGHTGYLTYGGYSFASAVEIDYSKIASVAVGFDTSSCRIANIPAIAGSIAGNIYDRIPYAKVEIFIYDFEVDDSFVIQNARVIYYGRLYRVRSSLAARYIEIEAKEEKYYYDKTAGVVCTEQCGAAYFGDKICGMTPTEEDAEVESIASTLLTLTATPVATDWTFNNGYVEYGGMRIKIQYWESGDVLNLISVPPASWVGATIKLVGGCGRDIASCRRYDNESNFFGLGYSMVNFNAIVEET